MDLAPVLSLDIATRTGACIGNGASLPLLTHVRLPSMGEEGGRFFWTYRRWLKGVIAEHRPSILSFERPILPRFTNITVTRTLQGLAAVTEEVAYAAGVDCREVTVQQVKTALTGYGHATKLDMMKLAQAYGLEPKVHDEADAFGCWLATLRVLRPVIARNGTSSPGGAPDAQRRRKIVLCRRRRGRCCLA